MLLPFIVHAAWVGPYYPPRSMPSSPCACTGYRPRHCLRCHTPDITSRSPTAVSNCGWQAPESTFCPDHARIVGNRCKQCQSYNCGRGRTLRTLSERMLKTSAETKARCIEKNWSAGSQVARCFASVLTAASADWPEKTLLQRAWKRSIEIRSEGSRCSSCMTGPLKTPSCRTTRGLSSSSHGSGSSPRRRETTCTYSTGLNLARWTNTPSANSGFNVQGGAPPTDVVRIPLSHRLKLMHVLRSSDTSSLIGGAVLSATDSPKLVQQRYLKGSMPLSARI